MAVTRLAGKALRGVWHRKPLKDLGTWEHTRQAVMPRGALEWGVELAPDLIGAGMMMMNMEGATPLERAMAGAFDLGAGLGLSFGGRLAGGAIGDAGARLGGATRARDLRRAASTGAGIGGYVGPMSMIVMPYEKLNPAYGGYVERMQAQGAQQQELSPEEYGMLQQLYLNAAQSPKVTGLQEALGMSGMPMYG